MAKFRVTFSGEVEVEADSHLEAESNAAFDCSLDNCRAECIEDCDEDGFPNYHDEDEEDEDSEGDEEEHF